MMNKSCQFVLFSILSICLAIFVRLCISLNSYSGAGKGPLYGDYEAQRHWMEITYNLPILDWYKNTTENDLLYWGLDYPPLTAYHSYILGYVQSKINASWIQLSVSRGHESSQHKLFMRYSVLLVDAFIYIPSLFVYFYNLHKNNNHLSIICCCTIALLYPGLMLIDYGHFQYNVVSLGLKIWAVVCLMNNYHLASSVFFVLALNYKQMELYHSIPFFCYLLARILHLKETIIKKLLNLVVLSLVVLLTFAFCWLPFLFRLEDSLNVLQRLFPVNRGLFEDKVANFWCSISVVFKLKNILSNSQTIRLCAAVTLLCLSPSALNLLKNPTILKFKYSLVNCSLAFFLFSFHVHEKTILIPASSVILLIPYHPIECIFFLHVSTLSMLPLFIKDGLVLPFISSSVLFYIIFDLMTQFINSGHSAENKEFLVNTKYTKMVIPSAIGSVCLGIALLYLPAPTNLPDIYVLLHSMFCCAHFLCFLIYFNWCQFQSKSDCVAEILMKNYKEINLTKKKN